MRIASKTSIMARYLPLFPLSIVVFPGEKLNLHIFEPRYKQLILECVTEEKTFGIPVYLNSGVGDFGTEVKILNVAKKYDNGEMDIHAQGLGVIKITHFDKQAPGRLYAGGETEAVASDMKEDIVAKLQIKDLLKQLYESLGLNKLYLELAENFTSYDIGHRLGFSVEQEYLLLQNQLETERQEIILQHLRTIVPLVQETERLKDRIKLNGHFKHLIPPNF